MHYTLQNAETINRSVEQGELLLKTFYVQDAARSAGSCDTDGATSVCVRAAKRKFRIVKRENNIPVLGVCEYCNAEFTVDPETIGRPKDAHARIQKQFIEHKCKRQDASENAARIVIEGADSH